MDYNMTKLIARGKKVLLALTATIMFTNCTQNRETEVTNFLNGIQDSLQVLRTRSALAQWNGSITGKDEDFEEGNLADFEMTKYLSNKEVFTKLKEYKTLADNGKIKDEVLKRQLQLIYNNFLANQADTALLNKIITKVTEITKIYGAYRAEYKGKKLNDNEVEEILKTSTNNKMLQNVWESHKGIGELVEKDLIELVKLRNQLAQSLGFKNFHSMQLKLVGGLDADEVTALLDQLDSMTARSFAELKDTMDMAFAKRYNVKKEELMPWHYQGRYFQEAPELYHVELDKYYKGKNLEELTTEFYKSIGLYITKIMANSSLYPQEGKNQHAFCTDIDGNGDVRILCNITDNEQWMGTMLHEFGHGVYALGHDIAYNPYVIRDAASPFTTEAIAMLFGRLSRNAEWMQKSLGISNDEKEAIAENCFKSSRLQQIVFSRWVQVVYRFELSMYDNPDQDLNALWWNLVEKYQLLKKPEGRNAPDYASKIHIALYPCYYQYYQMGEMFASQLHNYIVNNITHTENPMDECYVGNKEIGKWLNEKVFKPGMLYEWNDLIEKATGERLTAKYYASQFNLY